MTWFFKKKKKEERKKKPLVPFWSKGKERKKETRPGIRDAGKRPLVYTSCSFGQTKKGEKKGEREGGGKSSKQKLVVVRKNKRVIRHADVLPRGRKGSKWLAPARSICWHQRSGSPASKKKKMFGLGPLKHISNDRAHLRIFGPGFQKREIKGFIVSHGDRGKNTKGGKETDTRSPGQSLKIKNVRVGCLKIPGS